MIEGIHNRIQYLRGKGEFKECKGGNQGIQKGISARYERCEKIRKNI